MMLNSKEFRILIHWYNITRISANVDRNDEKLFEKLKYHLRILEEDPDE